ncbi:prepilin-type N-terminal cleavage/methylation domain-containing protein [uncultured Jatrophihabitans sp.]|uniref:prepilin-type N-terminal cleavage/methylation domain-containing protein n=1 Tax=uncultured Jatrophihabitans sp. TaxID=1610747 RepID=UPI0035CB9EAF
MFRNTLDKLIAIREDKKAEDGGFTLIELLVVVVIIGVLIAIAIPLYLNYEKGAADKSAQSDLRAAVSTLSQCYSENSNAYPAVPTGGADATGSLQFTCGTTTETAKLSSGTHLKYAQGTSSASFTLAAWNTNGHKNADSAGNEYTYDSTAGGTIGG